MATLECICWVYYSLKNNIEIFRLQYRQYCQDKIWLLDIEKDMYEFEVIRQTTSTKYSLMVFLYWGYSCLCFRLTVQDMSQAGNIPIRIENLPSQSGATDQGKFNNVLRVREGDSIELPCVGIGLPPPTYR